MTERQSVPRPIDSIVFGHGERRANYTVTRDSHNARWVIVPCTATGSFDRADLTDYGVGLSPGDMVKLGELLTELGGQLAEARR